MIGAMSARRRVNIVNDPVTPSLTNTSAGTSSNNLVGSGSFQFSFNATKLTCAVNVTGSVSGSSSTIQYFPSGSLIDPFDYEVMVTLGANSGNSNISTAGGSATLGVWHTLSTSPVFTFNCSGRRGGSRPITVDIRHRVNTAVSGSANVTMNQSSDAVDPVFTGFSGTTSITRTTSISYLGIYIDSESAANAGRIRTYKNTTIDANTGFTFSTGSIPEGEYEAKCDAGTVTPSGAMSFSGGSWADVSIRRANSPSESSHTGRFGATNVAPAGTGVMRLTIRHKLDQAKSAFIDKTFQTI